MHTPILFLIFNRPDVTQRVFHVIQRAQPKKLYVAADGPRPEKKGELELCRATRDIVQQINWPCEVKTLFREKNLGCKNAVSSAITWFFDHEPEGIILEDDCLPEESFFSYCSALLERYRDDERIMMMSGDNFQHGVIRGDGSYYFSKNIHIWGWASWRRAWQHYDVAMQSYPDFRRQRQIKNIFPKKILQHHWTTLFDAVAAGKIDTWDYQWVYAIWSNGGLGIIPNNNLISNIGFGTSATHTATTTTFANLPTTPLTTLRHPRFVIQHTEADNAFYRHHYPFLYSLLLSLKLSLT